MPDVQDPSEPAIPRRIDLDCATLGVVPPPCRIRMKFKPVGPGWTIVAVTSGGRAQAAATWIKGLGPQAVQVGTGLAPTVVWAGFETLPGPVGLLSKTMQVDMVEIRPQGAVSVLVVATRRAVEAFIASLPAGRDSVRSRPLAQAAKVQLTARQEEVLSLAVSLGYYEVPHAVHLRSVAKKCRLSVAAVSEILRRGVSQVVAGYVDQIANARSAELRTMPAEEAESAPRTPRSESGDVPQGISEDPFARLLTSLTVAKRAHDAGADDAPGP